MSRVLNVLLKDTVTEQQVRENARSARVCCACLHLSSCLVCVLWLPVTSPSSIVSHPLSGHLPTRPSVHPPSVFLLQATCKEKRLWKDTAQDGAHVNSVSLWAQNNFEITSVCFQFSPCSFINTATKSLVFKTLSFLRRGVMVVFVRVTCFC